VTPFALSLPEASYSSGERRAVFIGQLLERLRALPGVRGADAGLGLPLTNFRFNFSLAVAGRPTAGSGEQPSAEVRVATPEYFGTTGIPSPTSWSRRCWRWRPSRGCPPAG
jgi:hypothetical protein